jgi:hypothetical protein
MGKKQTFSSPDRRAALPNACAFRDASVPLNFWASRSRVWFLKKISRHNAPAVAANWDPTVAWICCIFCPLEMHGFVVFFALLKSTHFRNAAIHTTQQARDPMIAHQVYLPTPL